MDHTMLALNSAGALTWGDSPRASSQPHHPSLHHHDHTLSQPAAPFPGGADPLHHLALPLTGSLPLTSSHALDGAGLGINFGSAGGNNHNGSGWLLGLDGGGGTPNSSSGCGDGGLDQAFLLHPLYPRLVNALCSCRQALASGGSEASRVDDAARRALHARQEAIQANLARGLPAEPPATQDPDLQDFMVQYIRVLELYRQDLAAVVQEMDQLGKDFDAGIAQLLQAAVNGADLHESTGEPSSRKRNAADAAGPAASSAGRGAAAAAASDSMDVDDAKDAIKKKYAVKLQELQQEFSRKRRKGKLPADAIEVLKTWWQDNINWPYPSEDVKRSLIERSGLDVTQVNNWFINQRKRHWGGREDAQANAAAQ